MEERKVVNRIRKQKICKKSLGGMLYDDLFNTL